MGKSKGRLVALRLQTYQFPKVVELSNEGDLRHNRLVTHTFPLEQVQEAFKFIENHPDQVRKAIITFE